MNSCVCEEYTDEILCESHISGRSQSRVDRILDILSETLQSDAFNEIQDEFVEQNCEIFDEEGDLPPQCMGIYQQYVQLIEDHLLKSVGAEFPDFQFEELIPFLKSNGDSSMVYSEVFELLNAVLDFTEFRSLMASFKRGQGISFDITTTKPDH